jgi:(p)ppGpp synthase/HD superfamily hydrolase
MTALAEAIHIATTAHNHQTDKAGQPYILHCLRVMLAMKDDEGDRVAAVLHDVVEDSQDWALDDLSEFGADIVETLDALTRRDGEVYFDYINRLSENPRAVRVKLADLDDNMDLARLNSVSEADLQRREKYRKARAILLSVWVNAAA